MKRSEFLGKFAIVPVCALGVHELDLKSNEEFCKELKRWADDYVGKIGDVTNCAITPTDEAYRVYAWRFKNREGIRDEWRGLIKSLVDAESKLKREGESTKFIGKEPCCIYWRFEPAICSLQYNYSISLRRWTESREKKFYARFLISKKQIAGGKNGKGQ